jgi:hypothetical protein
MQKPQTNAPPEPGDGWMPSRGWLARYCQLFGPYSEAPMFAHLATAMALLSTAIGWKAWLQWGESREPANLFVVLEGRSATARKTTTAYTASSLVRDAMRGIPDYMEDDPPLQVHNISHASHLGLLELVATEDKDKAKRWEDEPPPGHLWVWDEFGSLLGNPNDMKGADWIGRTRATLMEIYGGRHGGARSKATGYQASRCCVSLIATMTRQELEERVRIGLLRDGFMGRFVLVPYKGRERMLPVPPVMTRLDLDERDRLAAFLRKVALSPDNMGHIFDRLTPDGREFRIRWYTDRMTELDKACDSGDQVAIAVSEAMGRLQSTAMKVAAILAVSEMDPKNGRLDQIEINVDHVAAGVSFVEYALDEVRSLADQAFRRDEVHPSDTFQGRVIEFLRRHYMETGEDTVPRALLMSTLRDPNLPTRHRWNIIVDLHNEGYLEIKAKPTDPEKGGRPAHTVTLLPPLPEFVPKENDPDEEEAA